MHFPQLTELHKNAQGRKPVFALCWEKGRVGAMDTPQKTSRWDKSKSATDMANSSWLERKEAEATQAALANLSAIDNENNLIQDYLSNLRSMVLHLRQWELNGWDNHYRADLIEMIRTTEGQMERYSTAMKKQLKRYKSGEGED
jgi:hypothetical protein